jgi:hypothetical protein
VKRLNKVGAIPTRLSLLTLATLALATAAFADCQPTTANCDDGSSTTINLCCPGSGGQEQMCSCLNWSEANGYSNCTPYFGCNPDLAD